MTIDKVGVPPVGARSSGWESDITRLKEQARFSEQSHRPSAESIDEEQLAKAVRQVNETIKLKNTALKVEWNKETDRKIVAIMDIESGDVLREIPAKDFVEWEEAYVELLGMLFDSKI